MIQYEIQGNMVVLQGCSKDEVDLELPDEIEGKPVAKIDANAFSEMPNIKRAVIPGSCKVVSPYAFASCANLEELIIEEGVEVIEDWAFISTNIKSIALPKSLKSVGQNAFLGTEIKSYVDTFMIENNSARKSRVGTNNKCIVLPAELVEQKSNFKSEEITELSKALNEQLENLGPDFTTKDLDVPYVFDNSTFLLALYNRKPLEKFSIELANESKMNIGLYSEIDPEFVILRVNVMTNGQFISSFTIKTPYLENAEFKIVKAEQAQIDNVFYYYLTIKADLACYGNGNYDNEFALNQFDELIAKYSNQLAKEKISQEQFDAIYTEISEHSLSLINGFLSQVDGVPYLTYMTKLYDKVLSDQYENMEDIQTFYSNWISNAYASLSDYKSFESICYDLDELEAKITEFTGLSLEELNQKYDIELTDHQGYAIDKEKAYAGKDSFIELETNYKLHADFLVYLYKEMEELDKKFALLQFEK